jgi:hypothetical protein
VLDCERFEREVELRRLDARGADEREFEFLDRDEFAVERVELDLELVDFERELPLLRELAFLLRLFV